MSRKPSLKPKPKAGPHVINVTKNVAATAQLEAALSLWFRNGHPIPILVLAHNAHDCLDAMAKQIGQPSEYQVWLESMPTAFRERAVYVNDFCKHGAKDIDDSTPLDIRHSEFLMYFAARCYRTLYGKPTPLMFAFDLRVGIERPEMAVAEFREFLAQFVDVHGPFAVKREQFLEQMLPWIERLLAGDLLGAAFHLP